MKSRPFPEIPCVICSKPVDLSADLSADENGKAVHTECYVKRITTPPEGPIDRNDGGLKPKLYGLFPGSIGRRCTGQFSIILLTSWILFGTKPGDHHIPRLWAKGKPALFQGRSILNSFPNLNV
jgi:hypothetical protein